MKIAQHYRLGFALTLLALNLSCASFPFTESGDRRLTDFQAKDGEYFPDYLKHFFKKARSYELNQPSVRLASDSLRLIETRPLNLEHKRLNEANLSWSSDGVYLGYEISNGGSREILVKDLQGKYSKRLAKVPPKPKNSFYSKLSKSWKTTFNAGLRWSRDGKSFAFMSNGGTGEYNIYVGAIDEGEKKILSSSHKDGFAVWDPSEDALAFVSSRSGNGDIYHIDLNRSKAKRLSKDNHTQLFPEWLPNGRGIVYASGSSNNHDIYLLLKDGKGGWHKPRALVSWKQDDLRPMVSPDGKWLAFYSKPGDSAKTWNLHVIPLDLKGIQKKSPIGHTIVAKNVVIDLTTGPCWAPRSNGLFYAAVDAMKLNPIYHVDLFTGKRTRLETDTKMNRDLAVSSMGVLSYRAQFGAWDRVYLSLTNQGRQLERLTTATGKVHYVKSMQSGSKPNGETL